MCLLLCSFNLTRRTDNALTKINSKAEIIKVNEQRKLTTIIIQDEQQKQQRLPQQTQILLTKEEDNALIQNKHKSNKPIMYTYVDYNEPFVDKELVKLWYASWTEAGWDVHFLTHEDAQKYKYYNEYTKALDDNKVCCLPRQSYLRHIAMCSTSSSNGGYYSEIFTFPLHRNKFTSDDNSDYRILPNNDKLTIYDGMLGSILSGSTQEYERMAAILLNPNNIQKNAMIAIRYILYKKDTLFSMQSLSLMNQNFFASPSRSIDVCNNAKNKFIIRFHDGEILNQAKIFNITISNINNDRYNIIKKWIDAYKATCWNNNNIIPSSSSSMVSSSTSSALVPPTPLPPPTTTTATTTTTTTTADDKIKNRNTLRSSIPITLNEKDRTIITEDEHHKKIMDNTKLTEIYCDDDISCKVTNACVDISNNDKNNGNDDDGGITLKIITNNEEYYQKLQQKLSKIMLQAWVCKNCNRHIKKIEKFINGNEQIWGSNSVSPAGATLSVGIDINNCGHHLGDVLWPLIRLHLKFRDVQDVINNGIGYLFLQSPITPCDTIYHAVSEQVIRYHTSTSTTAATTSTANQDNNKKSEGTSTTTMCFENIYLGTHNMNFMPSSGMNTTFIPYDNFNRDMHTMKSLFYNTYGLNLNPNNNEQDTILITQKRKGYGNSRTLKYHNIANIPQIIKMIQTNYPRYKVQIISWEDYNMKQQVHIMSKTQLMISLPGSAIMNGFLLHNTSSLICYCQVGELHPGIKDDKSTYYNSYGVKFQKSNEFLLWFDHLNYSNYMQLCDEPFSYIHGLDTIINIDELNKKMRELKM